MLSRSVGVVAVMIFALQSVGQADAACQTVNGALCGGGGKGSISSVSGNVSLSQGAGILRASSGASISSGARILAGDGGAAQVNLGAGCFASVAPNSIATVTSQNGLTCLRQSDPYTAQTQGYSGDNNNNNWFAAGFVLLGVGGVACAAFCDNQSSSGPVSGPPGSGRQSLRRVPRRTPLGMMARDCAVRMQSQAGGVSAARAGFVRNPNMAPQVEPITR